MELAENKKTVQDLCQQGHELRKKGKLEDAITAYTEGIALDANCYECFHFLGETLAQKNELDQAIEAYRQATQINPKYHWSYHCLGLVYFWQGELNEAISNASRSIELQPDLATFHYHLGIYLERKDDLEEAFKCCQKAIKLDPNLASAYHIQGRALAKQQRWEEACKAYNHALQLEPNLPHLKEHLAEAQQRLNTGDSLEKAFDNYCHEIKQHPENLTLYFKALEIKKNRPELYEQLADILVKENRLDGAICFYKIALNLKPEKVEIYSKLGQILIRQKKFGSAIDNLRKVVEVKPHFSSYHALGLALENSNQFEEAISAYCKAIEHKPDYFWSYRHLGVTLMKKGDFEKAISSLRRAIEINPDYHGTYFDLGRALEKKKIIELEKTVQKEENFLEKGNKLKKEGKLQEAIECYFQAIQHQQESSQLYYELANTFYQQEQLNEAIKYWFKIIEIDPQFGPVYHKLVWTELNSGQLEAAIIQCEKAIKSCTENSRLPLIYTTVADLLTKQGQFQKANQYYQTAIEKQVSLSNPKIFSNTNIARERKPHFFVIGGMKCGSTSLYTYLCQHPQIIPALKKEIHFFNSYYDRGMDWYSSHFFPILKEQSFLTGEATPCLSEYGVWEKIAQHFPDLKLIVVLRNPIDRAYSHYNHTAQWFGAEHSFQVSVASELENNQLNKLMLIDDTAYRNVKSYYILLGLYVYWLKEWMKFFPKNQFLILKSEDLYDRPTDIMNQVFDFLKISRYENSSYENTFQGQYLSIDSSLRDALLEYYKPHNQKLEDFLGIKFNWK